MQEKLESARTYGRRQQQAEIAKGQRRAREKRTTGKYDATPTGGYGQPLEGFWVGEAPPMPAPTPPVPTPQVPAFPSNAPQSASIAEKLTDKNYDFYRSISEYDQAPKVQMMDIYAGQHGKHYIGDTPLRGWRQRTIFNGTLAYPRPLFPYWSEFLPRTNLYY